MCEWSEFEGESENGNKILNETQRLRLPIKGIILAIIAVAHISLVEICIILLISSNRKLWYCCEAWYVPCGKYIYTCTEDFMFSKFIINLALSLTNKHKKPVDYKKDPIKSKCQDNNKIVPENPKSYITRFSLRHDQSTRRSLVLTEIYFNARISNCKKILSYIPFAVSER